MVGLIALLFLLFGLPFVYYLFGAAYEKIEDKGGGGYCACLTVILVVLLNVLGAINMFKSCADNDKGPSYDYYDAPRK